MVLKVIENGKHKDIHIREGEVRIIRICLSVCCLKWLCCLSDKLYSCQVILFYKDVLYFAAILRCSCFQHGFPTLLRDTQTQQGWSWRGGGFAQRQMASGSLPWDTSSRHIHITSACPLTILSRQLQNAQGSITCDLKIIHLLVVVTVHLLDHNAIRCYQILE